MVSRSHKKEVAAEQAAERRKIIEELQRHDFPALADDDGAPTPHGGGEAITDMPTYYYLILSFVLFLIGTSGVLLRRNALIVLMGIELQLNAGNLALLAFSRRSATRRGTCSPS